MKNNYFWQFVCIILIAIILLQHACRGVRKPCPTADTITTVEHIYDTVWHELPVKVIHVPARTITQIEKVADVDTAAILSKYYSANLYEEMISDSNQDIIITDTISENEIAWRNVRYHWKNPVTIITNTITPAAEKTVKLLAGFRVGGTKKELTAIIPEIQLVSRKDNAYTIGYNLSAKSVELGLLWKISLKK